MTADAGEGTGNLVAHALGADTDELQRNLREATEILLEDREPKLAPEFLDVRTIRVA